MTDSNHRCLKLGAIACLVLLLGWLSIKRAVNGNADLSGNHRIWRQNLQTAYQPVRDAGPTSDDPDAYPPITYLLFAPLGALHIGVTALLVFVLNLGCTWWIWNWLGRQLQAQADEPNGWQVRWLAWGLIAPAWLSALLLGQNTLWLMVLVLWGDQLASQQRYWRSGLACALAVLIKVLPVVLLLPFVVRSHRRVLLTSAVWGIGIVVIGGSLYWGPETNRLFQTRWLSFVIHGPAAEADPHDPNTLRGSLRFHNQSWESVSARLLCDVPIHNRANAPRVNLLAVSAASWRLIYRCGQMLLLAGIIIGVAGLWRLAPSDEQFHRECLAFLCPTVLLISPIFWSHYLVWCWWPLCLVIQRAKAGERVAQTVLVLWILGQCALVSPVLRGMGGQLWPVVALWGVSGIRGWQGCWCLISGQSSPDFSRKFAKVGIATDS